MVCQDTQASALSWATGLDGAPTEFTFPQKIEKGFAAWALDYHCFYKLTLGEAALRTQSLGPSVGQLPAFFPDRDHGGHCRPACVAPTPKLALSRGAKQSTSQLEENHKYSVAGQSN